MRVGQKRAVAVYRKDILWDAAGVFAHVRCWRDGVCGFNNTCAGENGEYTGTECKVCARKKGYRSLYHLKCETCDREFFDYRHWAEPSFLAERLY